MMFRPVPTGEIAPGVYAIRTRYVNFYLIRRDDHVICFDTGTSVRHATRGLKQLGIKVGDVKSVFLTHSDTDHVGGLSLFTSADLFFPEDEIPLTDGRTKRAPIIRNPGIDRPFTTLKDGERITIGSVPVETISTPGHTLGSMSYLVDGRILIVGDVVELRKGSGIIGPGFLQMDREILKNSLGKLARLHEVELICTGHTGISREFDRVMEGWR
ncbi:MBL fold metallo-hydrolase [Candidatus Zixiibacteriota bacterium]